MLRFLRYVRFSSRSRAVLAIVLFNTFFILILILSFPVISFSEEIYEYGRMWPVLKQPWYFVFPQGITVNSSGIIYIADNNHCIQKYTSDGQFITKWGSYGSGDGQFDSPGGIGVDSSGNVYVADSGNYRIQKFTSDGQFILKWGSYGSGDGQFNWPTGIAIDSSGNVYVADQDNHRIQKFTSNGQFVTKWGSEGSGDGQFSLPWGIAIDRSGNVYVADYASHRIQKFTSGGQIITEWASRGYEDGQFNEPHGIAIDNSGNVYVADTKNWRIQKFTSDGQFITKWGSLGSNAGEFRLPNGIAISSDGNVYVSDDGGNDRIQAFKQALSTALKSKAIIAAGGGPFKGNNLWDATQMNTNFAYRTLISRGYTNDTIYYLSADRNLDLNGDAIPDVDADPTNSDLQSTITQWAKDAESLVVYLVGHGGDGVFRMSETEVLKAEDLASWLNELQQTTDGLVTVIYDAVDSGSFLSNLIPPPGKQRINITSTSPGEAAYFLNNGTLSFSYLFWSQIFGGATIYDAYVVAKDGVGVVRGTEKDQNPQIDDNGNGIGNDNTDGDLARNKYIGNKMVTLPFNFERMWPKLVQPWYFNSPRGVAVDSSGYVYVADTFNHLVHKFTPEGQFVNRWGSEGSGNEEFFEPYGIAIDSSGNFYVADTQNDRIQKFTSNGEFVTTWGTSGWENSQFWFPYAVGVDSSDYVYVADTDNHRIQKFTSSGEFVTTWGTWGSEDGQFNSPESVAVFRSSYVFVADNKNHRIQKFTANGQFISKWGSQGNGDGQFDRPRGVAVDSGGNVYVADSLNHRIQKFTSDGYFITKWGSFGTGDGEFSSPSAIVVDRSDHIYVADSANHRIQKFTSNGQFIARWGGGSEDGEFISPNCIAIASNGNVYVADTGNDRIQKFTSDGQFIAKWGSNGTGNGQFHGARDIAIDSNDNVYVADTQNGRIQKFTSTGEFVTTWGSNGSGNGQFNWPQGIAVDSSGNVYVADTGNNRIQKFTLDGQFVTKWGSGGGGDGQFDHPMGIAIDSDDNVYIVDSWNYRIQKFTSHGKFITQWSVCGIDDDPCEYRKRPYPEGVAVDRGGHVYVAHTMKHRVLKFTSSGQFLAKWGSFGNDPRRFDSPHSLTVDSNGSVYVADTANNRISVYVAITTNSSTRVSNEFINLLKNKAIIVEGGPYKNNEWDETQTNAKFAYSVLNINRGYAYDNIYFLSPDTNQDLYGDNTAGDVIKLTNDNLRDAITQWAKDADSLVVYLVGHGRGDGTFLMSETEVLKADELASWLNELQNTMQGLVTLVYEACYSGSFLPKLAPPPSGKQRIVITSASASESRPLHKTGSFSSDFWQGIYQCNNIYDAYVTAENDVGVVTGTGRLQNPQIDDNGNGIGNEKTDGDVARNMYIGIGIRDKDTPLIGPITYQISSDQTSATFAVEIESSTRIIKVWALVYSPDFLTTSGNTYIPSFDFTRNDQTGKCEGTYNGFTVAGTYTVTVYAMNEATLFSTKTLQVEQVLSNQYSLTITIAPSSAAGSVTKDPNKPTYADGEVVTLTATPNAGYTFSNWTGDVNGSTNPITLTMNGNKTVVANFTEENAPDISVTPLTYNFENVKVKKSKTASFKVQNNGKANLTITTLIIGPDKSMFKLTGGGGNKTIKSGKFLTLKITFKPTSKGLKQATLRITSNDPDTSPTDIPLSGTGQ